MVARMAPTRRSASPTLSTRAWSGRPVGAGAFALASFAAATRSPFLELEKLAIHLVGNADAARLDDGLGVLLDQHRLVDVATDTARAERPLVAGRGEDVAERILEKHRLEVLRRRLRLGELRIVCRLEQGAKAGRLGQTREA